MAGAGQTAEMGGGEVRPAHRTVRVVRVQVAADAGPWAEESGDNSVDDDILPTLSCAGVGVRGRVGAPGGATTTEKLRLRPCGQVAGSTRAAAPELPCPATPATLKMLELVL